MLVNIVKLANVVKISKRDVMKSPNIAGWGRGFAWDGKLS